jgi:hypothetical protein
MRLLIADHGSRSRVRRSTAWVVRQAGQRTHRNQCLALSAQPIVGENRHVLGLLFIPCCDEAAGVFEDLGLGRALRGRFPLGGRRVLCLHLAAVEAHVADFAAAVRRESSGRGILSVIRRWRAREGNTCHSQRLISQIMNDSTALARTSAENLKLKCEHPAGSRRLKPEFL